MTPRPGTTALSWAILILFCFIFVLWCRKVFFVSILRAGLLWFHLNAYIRVSNIKAIKKACKLIKGVSFCASCWLSSWNFFFRNGGSLQTYLCCKYRTDNCTMTCRPVHSGSSLACHGPARHTQRKAVFSLNCVIRFYSFGSQKIRNFWFSWQHSHGCAATWLRGNVAKLLKCYRLLTFYVFIFILLSYASVQLVFVSDVFVFSYITSMKGDTTLTFRCFIHY